MALTRDQSLEAYRLMKTIRRFEEKCAEHYAAGDIGGFLHLYIGQEAIAAAARFALREDDNLITAYRDHGVAIAKGLPIDRIMAEMFGKSTGVCGGKGGSMHLADKSKRFWGGWAIVGGHLPLASGIALADQYNGDDRVTLALMGDGSTNIGYFHESLNLSGVWKLPIIWAVENNQYGMGTSVGRASAVEDITQKAMAYGMPTSTVDGMDVIAIYDVLKDAIKHVRSKKGPYFVVIDTYRYRGHSMGDPERYRTPEEVEREKANDPIERWAQHLISEKIATDKKLAEFDQAAEEAVMGAIAFAQSSPFPTPEELYANVVV
jgi:pyruvate dehydrogenase E1 component alpha subunit